MENGEGERRKRRCGRRDADKKKIVRGERAKWRVGGMRNEQVWEEWAKHEHKV